MPIRRHARTPLWKQALAAGCLAYVLLAWVLPVAMMPFVGVLPFMHERTMLERLPFSVAGSALVVLVLAGLTGGRALRVEPADATPRQRAWHRAVAVGGLALFTWAGADLSANVFGLAARLLPHGDYRSVVVVDAVARYDGRQPRTELEFRDGTTGEPREVVLSRRLFAVPTIVPGDVVELRGRTTAIGVYVQAFSLRAPAAAGMVEARTASGVTR